MVNNAGIVGTEMDALKTKAGGNRAHEASIEVFDMVMDINIRGVLLGCKYALQQFLRQDPLPPNGRGKKT